MQISHFVLASLIAMGIAGCSSPSNDNQAVTTPEQNTSYQTMSIDELAGVMADPNSNSDFTVVNVHIPYEGKIEGTDYNVAYNDLDALKTTLPDKDAPIILYCRSGNMSEQAAQDLAELGYTQIYDVPGGMIAWESSGYPLVGNE
jgi:rhodanese-related sulfurtransferase